MFKAAISEPEIYTVTIQPCGCVLWERADGSNITSGFALAVTAAMALEYITAKNPYNGAFEYVLDSLTAIIELGATAHEGHEPNDKTTN